ncbi:MAG TPA: hypothetical protein HA258_04305 [Thermoplasmata archaeon]|nr:hypothetical protein [Thermoplasmata archaeon]HIH29657.1 hypothetical protein [Thermoplasmata archaeon]
MKKKVKSDGTKKLVKSSSSKQTKKNDPSVQKVMVGEDEFCPTCMEWRSFDELTGKCKVCGRIIKKTGEKRKITDEYDLKDFSNEHDEPQETGEF